ncbi:peptidyl-prolyl cis-trans isomerase [Terrihabitans sp. B22-R8]|uniref:peptidyl-prolyl cis-trans isomerase n=1 Tax=Terrihabitans sp. B22-R8 TaxID=3425128 RepID=UPI00403CD45A
MESKSAQPDAGAAGAGREQTQTPRRAWSIGQMAREPLLQFLVIGAIIFAVHAVVTPSVSAERLIEVTPEIRQSIIDTFKRAHEGREPAEDELAGLIDVWVLNEITFREALSQGLDKGDEMIRDRVTHKMRLLIFNGVDVQEPTREDLETWYEKHRVRYDVPDLVSFIEVPFTGPDAEAEARRVLEDIKAEREPEDIQNRAHLFAERPRLTLVPSFGQDFVDRLVTLEVGDWQVMESKDGWHIVRLDTFKPGRAVPLSEVDSQVTQSWKDERRRILAIAATRDLGTNYVIRR